MRYTLTPCKIFSVPQEGILSSDCKGCDLNDTYPCKFLPCAVATPMVILLLITLQSWQLHRTALAAAAPQARLGLGTVRLPCFQPTYTPTRWKSSPE